MTVAVIEMKKACPTCFDRHRAINLDGVIITDQQPWIVRCARCAEIRYRAS